MPHDFVFVLGYVASSCEVIISAPRVIWSRNLSVSLTTSKLIYDKTRFENAMIARRARLSTGIMTVMAGYINMRRFGKILK